MLTLPLWLAIYLSIGILCVLWWRGHVSEAVRPYTEGASGARISCVCALAVLVVALGWPFVVTGIVRAVTRAVVQELRGRRYPHASPLGGYQPRSSGKDRGNPPSGGSSGRRPGR